MLDLKTIVRKTKKAIQEKNKSEAVKREAEQVAIRARQAEARKKAHLIVKTCEDEILNASARGEYHTREVTVGNREDGYMDVICAEIAKELRNFAPVFYPRSREEYSGRDEFGMKEYSTVYYTSVRFNWIQAVSDFDNGN